MKKYIIVNMFLGLISCSNVCNKKEIRYKEFHIIPDGYAGRIVICFNQTDGKEIEIRGDSLFFRVEFNGILKTKFPKFQEHPKGTYYFVESNLNKRLPEWTPQNKDSVKFGIGIFNEAAGHEFINGKLELMVEYFVGDSNLYYTINQ